jgi:phage shock protein A
MSDIVNANINSLLEKATDPAKLSKLMIQEMQETLVEIKASVAKVLADRKKVERLLDEKLSKKAYFEDKAQMAVDKDREDLAKRILEELIELEDEIQKVQEQRDNLNAVIEDYRSDIERLETKLGEARHKSKLLDERLKAAQQHKKVEEKLHKAHHESAFQRIDDLQHQIEKLDSESESMGFGSVPPSLEKEIADLEHEGEIKDRLAALKKKARKND